MADELSHDVAHQVKNVVRDPQGDVLSEISGEFRVSSGEEARHDWLTGIMVSTVVQFEAAAEGSYTIEHLVDDASSSLPIHVIHGLPPGISPSA